MGGRKKNKSDAVSTSNPITPSSAAGTEAACSNGRKLTQKPSAVKSHLKESKIKGQKTYSFSAPATEMGGAANLDRSVFKVLIECKLEERIINLINNYRQQHGGMGTVSGRLTAKKLQDLYMALQGFSFKPEHVEKAMENTVLYGGDLHSALDWLCLNLPNDALPEGFSQKLQEEEKKNRPKFQLPADLTAQIQVSEIKKYEDYPEKKETTKQDEKEKMKKWILSYAEQESDDETGDENVDEKALENNEHFDPNERYLELTAKLFDAKEEASAAKDNKNKPGQQAAQEKIRSFNDEMKLLESHPLFNPSIKVLNEQKEKKKITAASEEGDTLDLSLFTESVSSTEEKDSAKHKEPKDIRNFDYSSRSWTGKSPKQFLIDWCRKNLPKSPNPSFEKIPLGRYWKSRVKVQRSAGDVLSVCPTILTEDSMQAQHLAATLALYYLVKGQSVHQLLPPTYRDVWLEWSDAEKKKEEQNKLETSKPRDQFITKLLSKLKQQQQQQQSKHTSVTSEEPEESWENLASLNDFDNLSLDQKKTQGLESARSLFKTIHCSTKYKRLLKDRQQLPVFLQKDTIMETLHRHRVVVVAGETGSGKSTQIPQFLLEDLLATESKPKQCNIVCTQPRRISAVSLATRVSDEMGSEDGPGGKDSLCGYQIRMESRAGENTRLLYCTTGVLLRKMQRDGFLMHISHVIMDEVHERSVQSDFLLIILKELLQKRLDLHLILMSATVDSDKFAKYFGHCPVINIPGRTFPVEVFHLEDVIEKTGFILEQDSEYCQKFIEEEEEITITCTGKGGRMQKHQEYILKETMPEPNLGSDCYQQYSSRTRHALQSMIHTRINIDLILELLDFLDKSEPFKSMEGAVLIFLPGLADIQHLYDLLCSDRRFRAKERYKLIALHSILSSQDQAAAFTVPPQGIRKIVLATNIAETGITIPDVAFVIDTGKTKENRYHDNSQMSSLVETFVSKASALQRKGRAGRVREGFCFRLYTKERYQSFNEYSVPEILRVPLEELCLHIMKCKLGSPEEFLTKALDPPHPQMVSNAMNLLRKTGACEMDQAILTPLGQHLAALPVNVKIGKMLIFGAIFGCLDPVATIAAAITEKSPFSTPMNRKDEADLAKAALAVANSDHLTIYNAYLSWKKARTEGYRAEMSYCRKHFLSRTALLTIEDVKQELIRLVEAVGFVAPSPRTRTAPVSDTRGPLSLTEISFLKSVLTAGLYDNVAKIIYAPSVDVAEKAVCTAETAQGKAHVHPSSVNRSLQAYGWLLFQEKVKYGKVYIRDTSLISPFPILLFGGKIDVQHREGLLIVDGWIHFQAPVRIGVIFKQLRNLIDSVLKKKLENPKISLEDDKTIQIIMELIKTENGS